MVILKKRGFPLIRNLQNSSKIAQRPYHFMTVSLPYHLVRLYGAFYNEFKHFIPYRFFMCIKKILIQKKCNDFKQYTSIKTVSPKGRGYLLIHPLKFLGIFLLVSFRCAC